MRKLDLQKDFAGKEIAGVFSSLRDGDELVIPPGDYQSGPLCVEGKDITIVLEEGAVIHFSDDPLAYPPVKTRWEGVVCYAMHPCLLVRNSSQIVIRGKGTLDGNGMAWWKEARKKKLQKQPVSDLEKRFASLNPDYREQAGGGGGRASQFLRPALFQVLDSQNILIQDVILKDSPFWTLHPVFSDHITIRGVRIDNPADSPNTDGIDVDSCTHVEIDSCLVTVGDDGIAMKSGIGEDALRVNRPTAFVFVHDCTVRSAHGGTVIGSDTGAGIHDIKVEHCLFDGTDRGIRIKTRRGRAGLVERVLFRDIRMENVLCPITVNMFYACGADDSQLFSQKKQPVSDTTPHIRDIDIEKIQANGIRSSAAFIVGLPESPIQGLSMDDCSFAFADKLVSSQESEMSQGLPEMEGHGIRLRNAEVKLREISGTDTFVETGVTLN